MNVLITGASKGIGKATAEKYRSENHNVYTPQRSELDLIDNFSIENYIKAHNETFDVIINCAGINDINLLENITDEEIFRMFQTNAIAPLKLLRGLVGGMKKREFGYIVNIASIWAVVSKAGRTVYSSTKNAIHGITNSLAVELAEYNILVNTICPGFTATELTYKNNTKEQIAKIVDDIPLKRMAEPKEIANLIYLLGSKENTYITGQKISIDGGFTIK